MLFYFRQRSSRATLHLGGPPAVALKQSAQLRDRGDALHGDKRVVDILGGRGNSRDVGLREDRSSNTYIHGRLVVQDRRPETIQRSPGMNGAISPAHSCN